MTGKGERPDRPDLSILTPDSTLRRVWIIGPAQDSIIVNTGRWGGRHRYHPPPILGRQRCGRHHVGVPRRHGGVQPPLTGDTHQGEEGNDQG